MKNEITTPGKYVDFVQKFVTLLDKQLAYFEENLKEDNLHNIASSMPALISLVNTVGYLREQDGMFLDIRPRTDNQKDFYEYEYAFEMRLNKLIETVLDSKEKDYYISRLTSYMVESRTKQQLM